MIFNVGNNLTSVEYPYFYKINLQILAMFNYPNSVTMLGKLLQIPILARLIAYIIYLSTKNPKYIDIFFELLDAVYVDKDENIRLNDAFNTITTRKPLHERGACTDVSEKYEKPTLAGLFIFGRKKDENEINKKILLLLNSNKIKKL